MTATSSLSPDSPLRNGAGWLLGDTDPAEVFIPEEFTADHLMMARAASEFLEGEVLPRSEAIERHEPGLNERLLKQAGALGLLGTDVPPEWGGLGLDLLPSSLVAERLGLQASFAVTAGAHAGIGTLPLVYFGTDDQKRRYLPKLVTAEIIGAFSLSEEGYGSDALGAATRARLNDAGTHYVLNGTKMWTSNAGFADLFTVFAQVEGAAAEGRTFTAFLVERGFPGVSTGREEHKLGIKGSSTCRVILDDARVPVENVLHTVGEGHVVALNVLNAGRLRLAIGLLGPARELVRVSARYANERRQMGRPISHFGLIRHKLAEQAIRLYAAESACWRACGMIAGKLERLEREPSGDGLPPHARAFEEYLIECAMLKVQSSEMLDYVVDEALQIHGGYGYTEEFPIARAYRDSRINRIFEGTNEINRLTVSGTLFRRAQRGRLPLTDAIRGASEELLGPPSSVDLDDAPLAAERAALADARKLFLVVSGSAARRSGEGLAEQQEILGALADVAIDLFAAESAVLRAVRLAHRGAQGRAAQDMAQVFTDDALARIEEAARRVTAAVLTGDEMRSQLALLRRFSRRRPIDSIALRRAVAAPVIAEERYPLAPGSSGCR